MPSHVTRGHGHCFSLDHQCIKSTKNLGAKEISQMLIFHDHNHHHDAFAHAWDCEFHNLGPTLRGGST